LVELLPYHDIAKGKHTRLGTKYNPKGIPMREPSEEVRQRTISIFAENGIEATI
jgi:pyruvate formate lyase activating enzyme